MAKRGNLVKKTANKKRTAPGRATTVESLDSDLISSGEPSLKELEEFVNSMHDMAEAGLEDFDRDIENMLREREDDEE